jgi:chemotaxis receptor (MCP) glutamine deamidase CheD
MLLDRLSKNIINFPEYEIIASDIDRESLIYAKRGIYNEYSLHETPKNYLNAYFTIKETQLGPQFFIHENIKNKVEFIQEDIIRGHNKKIKYDVIFCRNFLIYINRESKEKLLRILQNHLVHGGLLVLGKTESIVDTNSTWNGIDNYNHFYVKNRLKQGMALNRSSSITNKKKNNRKELLAGKSDNKIENSENKIKLKIKDTKLSKNKKYMFNYIKEKKIEATSQRRRSKSKDALTKELEMREMQIFRRINLLNLREEQLHHREILLEQREILIDLKEKELENKYKEFEIQKNKIQALVNKQSLNKVNNLQIKEQEVLPLGSDQILTCNEKRELIIPEGHYSIINFHDKTNPSTKFSVLGLGIGIALILKDSINKIFAISHIIYPKYRRKNKNSVPRSPHKYADTSVKDLLDKLLYYGANRDYIEAVIVGGARAINNQGNIHQKNIDAVTQELVSYQIPIEAAYIGGISERSLIYDTNDNSLFIKKIWESEFRRAN